MTSGQTLHLPRVLAAGVFGALAGLVSIVVAYGANAPLALRLDRELPPFVSGFYPVERDASGPFVWTGARAELRVPGLDRRAAWHCSIRFRGARVDTASFPEVTATVDGATVTRARATNDVQALEFDLPARPDRRGAVIGITSSSTFTPGPHDPRDLGVVIREIGCRPAEGAIVLPPRYSLFMAALAAAFLGAAFALSGVTAGSAIGGAVLVAGAQAAPMAIGVAPYSLFGGTAAWLALAAALALAGGVRFADLRRDRPLRNTAKFAAAFSAVVWYLSLLVLLHPEKLIGDAALHAQRLGWVLGGRFFFTSITPEGLSVPCPIGLYLVAAPFAWLTTDHVALLRVIVATADATAGLVVYVMVARAWGDRLAAAGAVVLFHLVPWSVTVQGAAVLTNAFGQSVAVVAVAAVVLPSAQRLWRWPLAGAAVAVWLALISHAGTAAFLVVMLLVTTALYHGLGSKALRPAGRFAAVALLLGTLAAVLSWYGHFGDVYPSDWERLRQSMVATVSQDEPAGGLEGSSAGLKAQQDRGAGSTTGRLARVGRDLRAELGVPVLVLAIVGAWRLWTRGDRDRLTLALVGWTVTCLLLLALGIFTAVDGRHDLALYPVLAIAGAIACAWGWRQGGVDRAVTTVLLAWSLVSAVRNWIGWIS